MGGTVDDDPMNTLTNARAAILIELSHIKEKIEQYDDDTPLAAIMVSRKELTEQKANFQSNQKKILAKIKTEKVESTQGAKIREYKEYVTFIDTKLTQLELLHEPPVAQATQPPPMVHEFISMEPRQLPLLEFPMFDGQYNSWMPFKEKFLDLIGNKENYSAITKYYYLEKCMRDQEALQIIRSQPDPASGYATGWAALTARFEKSRLIIKAHTLKLLSPPQTDFNGNSIRKLSNEISINVNASNNMGVHANHWDYMTINVTIPKLPAEVQKAWFTRMAAENSYTLADFKNFLEEQASVAESVKYGNGVFNNGTKTHVQKTEKGNSSTNVCVVCKAMHPLYHCSKFKTLTVKQRQEKVKQLGLCLNCFRPTQNLCSK
jgi:hypothetical protein